jgi:hypothetical protein
MRQHAAYVLRGFSFQLSALNIGSFYGLYWLQCAIIIPDSTLRSRHIAFHERLR